MTERRAITTVAAIALVAVACVLGLGLVARAARASGQPEPVGAVATPTAQAATPFTLGSLGLEPGALALIGLSGVVSCWPGQRRRRSKAGSGAALESAREDADRDELLAPAA